MITTTHAFSLVDQARQAVGIFERQWTYPGPPCRGENHVHFRPPSVIALVINRGVWMEYRRGVMKEPGLGLVNLLPDLQLFSIPVRLSDQQDPSEIGIICS